MNAAAWIALGFGLVTMMLNLIALAVGYGVLKGTVQGLHDRVAALETEIGAITELKVAVGKIEAKQDAMFEQLRDLAASVRWMRDPATPKARTPRT